MFKLKLFFALAALPALCFGALDLKVEAELGKLGQGAIEPGRDVPSPFDPSKLWRIGQNFGETSASKQMPEGYKFEEQKSKKATVVKPAFKKPKLTISKESVFADKKVKMPRALRLFKQVERNQKRTDARKSALKDAKRQAAILPINSDKNDPDILSAAVGLFALVNSVVGKK